MEDHLKRSNKSGFPPQRSQVAEPVGTGFSCQGHPVVHLDSLCIAEPQGSSWNWCRVTNSPQQSFRGLSRPREELELSAWGDILGSQLSALMPSSMRSHNEVMAFRVF